MGDEAQTGDKDVEVLVTAFGPFKQFGVNPSWLATRDLHDTYIAIDRYSDQQGQPEDETKSSYSRIHIQVIQTPTVYSHVLSLIPLIHGAAPTSPEASTFVHPDSDQPDPVSGIGPQGNGSPFPNGYPVRIPAKGHFDLVVHVGAGYPGKIAIEKQATKWGYEKPDICNRLAPLATVSTSPIFRGFGKGYEDFPDTMTTTSRNFDLVSWLNEKFELPFVSESLDSGQYLCGFLYYCSLCEARRSGANTQVQFIHVPSPDNQITSPVCQDVISKIIWWLCTFGRKA